MASVSSLDQDMRNLRMSRYTPQAANEVRKWIEETLGHSIPNGDLLEVLKDGVALCELANLALPPPGIRFKKSPMPFIQMENISHFLKACEMPPLNMPAHDRFLTVDLFEAKDPAQVLQCLGAFSRQAHAANPSRFRTTIGPKKTGVVSPTNTGSANGASWKQPYGAAYNRAPSPTKPSAAMPSAARAMSPALTGGSTGSQGSNATRSPGPVSSWSQKKDESNTAPAWNIHQYGYMGGASQGNQGISFGARRQITSQSPSVPSLAEKERQRKQKADEEERLRLQAEEAEHRRRTEREAEEERDRVEEEARWEEETRRLREEERRRVDEQKRQWEEQERKWQQEEEARRKEQAAYKKPPERPRVSSSSILRGQSLAQYQREQAALAADGDVAEDTPEQRRVRELEKQLEEARERERQYQQEREERLRAEKEGRSRPSTASTMTPSRPPTRDSIQQSDAGWAGDERDFLRNQHKQHSQQSTPTKPTKAGANRPFPAHDGGEDAPPSLPSRALPKASVSDAPADQDEPEVELPPNLPSRRMPQHEPEPEPETEVEEPPSLPQRVQQSDSASSIPKFNPESAPSSSPLGSSSRPLPTPQEERSYEPYSPEPPKPQARLPSQVERNASNPMGGSFLEQRKPNRTDQFLASTIAPQQDRPRVSSSAEAGDTSLEQQRDRDRRMASQQKTKTGGWASKSLLEREMEKERERQREWEENQKNVQSAPRDAAQGTGQGQSWDVNQYGYMGGDSMNRGSSTGSGISIGGRRQIIGPRPQGPR